MDRRTFLKYSLASGVVIWTGTEIPKLGMEVGELFVKSANAATVTEIFPRVLHPAIHKLTGLHCGLVWRSLELELSR